MPDEHSFMLRQIDGARADYALIEGQLEFIMGQLASQPTRRDLARTALGIIFHGGRDYAVCLDRLALNGARLIAAALVVFLAAPLQAREYRSREVTREFQREHRCPSTGLTSGACPGYRKDHIVPLACGGPDAVSNMQRQTIPDAKAKDQWERKICGR